MPRPSLKIKLMLSLAVLLTAAFLSLSLINYQITRDSIREDLLTSDLPLTRDTIFSEIQRDLIPPMFVSSSMANDSFLKDWVLAGEHSVEPIVKYLFAIHEKYDFFSTFFISERTRTYYHYKGVLKAIDARDPHDDWYFTFIGSSREHRLDVDTNQAADDILTIFLNYRVTDARGRLLGVAGVGLKLDTVADLFRSYQRKYHRTIMLVDPTGLIQVHSNDNALIGTAITEMEGLGEHAREILIRRGEPADFEYDVQGSHHLVTVRHIPEIDWFLLVAQSEDQAMEVVKGNLWRTIGIGSSVSALILLLMLLTLNFYQSRLEAMATTDPLTGAANRRRLDEHFEFFKARSRRLGRPFCVVVMDMDNFKSINDTLGHLAGDMALKAVANAVRQTIRSEDVLARWGGDEFLALADGDLEHIRSLAERIQRSIAALPPLADGRGLSISVGVAEFEGSDSLDSLSNRADQALLRMKQRR